MGKLNPKCRYGGNANRKNLSFQVIRLSSKVDVFWRVHVQYIYMNKILGIDFGTKRIGLATSNMERNYAFPLKVIEAKNMAKSENMQEVIDEIVHIARAQEITEIVIGESKNFKGKENPIMTLVHEVKKKLEAVSPPFTVILEPEFLTSAEAERHQGKGALLDASAAAIILQSYLDRLQKANQA